MNKGEFLQAITDKTGVARKDVATVFEGMSDIIAETLKKDEKISLAGFGNWEIKNKAARKGRNPATGDIIDIPAKRVPYFRPSANLKESI